MDLVPMTLLITFLTVVAACKTRDPNKNLVPEGASSQYINRTEPAGVARPPSIRNDD